MAAAIGLTGTNVVPGAPVPRKQVTSGGKEQPHDNANVEARHRQNMRQPGGDEITVFGGGDGLFIAREQRDRDGAGGDRQHGQYARGNAGAQVLQPGAERIVRRRGGDRDIAQGKAGGGKAREIILPPLIPAAGVSRAVRREEHGVGVDALAHGEGGGVGAAQVQANGAGKRRRAVQARVGKGNAACAGQQVNPRDGAREANGSGRDAGQRRFGGGAPLSAGKA